VIQQVTTTAARDTIATVFAQRAYDRTIVESLWDRIMFYLWEQLGRVLSAIGKSSATRPVALGVLGLLAVLAIVRIVIAIRSAEFTASGTGARRLLRRRVDPWLDAQRLAAEHRYTDAAHALYAALLESVAKREDLRLHPSKTVGDYLRELRWRSSALVPSFRDFARLYEVVVYGLGICDQERYERLYALASGMLTPAP
jgi:hypothetical protein